MDMTPVGTVGTHSRGWCALKRWLQPQVSSDLQLRRVSLSSDVASIFLPVVGGHTSPERSAELTALPYCKFLSCVGVFHIFSSWVVELPIASSIAS